MESVDPKLVEQWQLPEMNNNKKLNKVAIILGVVVAALLVLGIGVFVGNRLTTNDSQQVAAGTTSSASSLNQNPSTEQTPPPTVTVVQTEVVTQPAGQRQTSSSSTIACDGRGVLIVSSIIDIGQDISAEANTVMAKYPGSKTLWPGACSSLRASVDGNLVYAVVIDYGYDTASLCSAAARLGGNPRTLNNRGDFTNPCL